MRNYVTTYNPFFDFFFDNEERYNTNMETDVIEREDHYEMRVNLPYVKKEDIKLSLENGYLKISAKESSTNNDKERFLLRERNYGSYSREFYIDENITKKDITAKLENGILYVRINKPDLKQIEEKKYIQIQ